MWKREQRHSTRGPFRTLANGRPVGERRFTLVKQYCYNYRSVEVCRSEVFVCFWTWGFLFSWPQLRSGPRGGGGCSSDCLNVVFLVGVENCGKFRYGICSSRDLLKFVRNKSVRKGGGEKCEGYTVNGEGEWGMEGESATEKIIITLN